MAAVSCHLGSIVLKGRNRLPFQTVNAVDCDLVLVATPIDLTRLIDIKKPHKRIGYHLPGVDGVLAEAVRRVVS